MSLILKQEPANTIATPPAGKSTLFITDNSLMAIKTPAGSVTQFPTVQGSNTEIFFNDEGAINGSANLTFTKTTNTLTLTNGNIVAQGVKTSNLYYANGNPWDLQQPAGSNTAVQFNDSDSFGGSANFTFNTSTNVLAVTGNINAGNVSATTFTGALTGNATGSAATVTTAAQANITSVGTLTSLNSSGTITAPAFTANTGVFTGNGSSLTALNASNVSSGTLAQARLANADVTLGSTALTLGSTVTTVAGLTSVTSTTFVGALTGAATGSAATVTTAAQPNITSVGTLTGLTVGNATANAVFGNGTIVLNSGLITGNGNGLSSLQGTNVTGTLNSTTLGNSTVYIGTTGIELNRATAAQSLTGITSIDGYAATVSTAAQPNITSTGTLTSLTVTGNITGGNLSTAGAANVGNLNVTGNVTSALLPGANVTYDLGSPTQCWRDIYLSNSSIFLGDAVLSGDGNAVVTTGTLTGANISTGGELSVTGNANVGNLGTGGLITATGNVSGGNLTTGGVVTATGNITGGNVIGTLLTGTLSTAAQPNITSTGTLASLSVTANANVGNIGAAAGIFTTVAGSLTTAAQSNITSVGSLTSLTVTGNANVGNLGTAGLIIATGNISGDNLTTSGLVSATGNITSSANVVTDLIVGRTSGITITATGTNQNINLAPTGTGKVNVGNFIISNLATPVASTDAATKQYVDDVAQGLNIHDSCNAATTGTLATISGGVVTYNNGTAGVGATLTTTGTYTTIDGVTLADGMRILVKNEATTANNGIYVRTSATVLTRAADFNSVPEVEAGDFTFVTAGTVYDNTGWVQTASVTTIGTDPIDWAQFSGAGTYSAGTGLTLTGSVFSVNASQTQITSVGTLTSLNVVGTTTGAAFTANTGVFTGNGSALTALNASNVSSGTLAQARLANASVTLGSTALTLGSTVTTVAGLTSVTSTTFVGALTGAATSATTAGTVTTAAQGNITSVGTLTGLTIGNATANAVFGNGTIVLNSGLITGNGNGLSSLVGANVTGAVSFATTANAVAGANVSGTVSSATTAGTVTTAAQGNITSVGTLTSLNSSGTITAPAFTANTGVFTGNGSALTALNASNVSTGTLAQARLANASVTLGSTALTLGSTVTTVAGLTSVTSTTFVGALTGAATSAGSATTAGTVTTAAQPNITSTGTLTSLTVTGNISGGNISTGGQLNVTGITTTNGTILPTWNLGSIDIATVGGGSAASGRTLLGWNRSAGGGEFSIITNRNGGSIGGVKFFEWANTLSNTTTEIFSVTAAGAVTTPGTIGATGNVSGGNITTAGRLVSSIATGTAPLTITSTTRVANLNVDYANVSDFISVAAGTGNNFIIFANAATGNITELTSTGLIANLSNNSITATTFVGALSGAATSATTAGTVTTAAQGNITSVGTLTGLTIGNATANAVFGNGTIVLNSGLITGNGSGLTALNASNISSGTLAQARLANASVTLGSTALTLGATVTTVAGLTSVTSTTFVGALTGAASSATTAGTVTTAAQPNITSVGTLSGLTVTATITGSVSGSAGTAGSATTAGTVTTAAQPNITSVSTSFTSLTFANARTISGNNLTLSAGSNVLLGTITGNWSLSAGSRLNATYADLAEKYVSDVQYTPGTVLVFGGNFEVTKANSFDSSAVAGVVSTNPAYLMNSACDGEITVELALIGRVPVNVCGSVTKGDLMVTGPNGHAVSNNMARAGTVIGKSLENFTGEFGTIEIVVGKT